MERVVATWPDGAEVTRTIREMVPDRVTLRYDSNQGDGVRAKIDVVSSDDGRDVDLSRDIWYVLPPSRLRRSELDQVRRRLLWLLVATRSETPLDVQEIHTSAATLGYPYELEPHLAPLIDSGASMSAVVLASGGDWERHLEGLKIARTDYDLLVRETSRLDEQRRSPEAERALGAWRWSRGVERGEPEWCVVGPSVSGSLLSFGDTPWEALRACRLLVWPGELESWTRTWTDPGTLVLPSEEEARLFQMLGEGCPLWWGNDLWREWVRSRE